MFRILGFNVLHPDYASTDRYPFCDSKHLDWEGHRKDLVFDIIRKADADVCMLQEVDLLREDQFQTEFGTQYNIYLQYQKGRKKDIEKWRANPELRKPNTCAVATLIRKSRFDVIDVITKSRSMTTIVTDKQTSKQFSITNVHLEANRRDDKDEIHKSHIESIVKSLSEKKIPHIVAGDFNAFPDDPPIEYLKSLGFIRWHGSIEKATFLHFNRTETIDHLLSTPDMIEVKVTWVEPRDKQIPSSSFPSDHLAIVYDAQWK